MRGFRFHWLLVLALAALEPITLSLSAQTTSPEKTSSEDFPYSPFEAKAVIEGQLKAIAKKDLSKAYFLYTTASFRQTSSLPAFTQFIETYADYWRNAKIDFDHIRTEKGGLLLVKGTMTSTQGKKLEISYYLMKDSGRWKILGLHLTPAPPPDPNLPQVVPEN